MSVTAHARRPWSIRRAVLPVAICAALGTLAGPGGTMAGVIFGFVVWIGRAMESQSDATRERLLDLDDSAEG